MQLNENKKEILIDSSSIILLQAAGLLTDVARLYDVLIPTSVYEEITISGKPGAEHFKRLRAERGLRVLPEPSGQQSLTTKQKGELQKMGRGEREVLTHVLAGDGSFPVVDDLRAVRFLAKYEISFINALLMPRILRWTAVISQKKYLDCLSVLQERGRYSASIIKRAGRFQALDLQQFFP